MQKIIIKPPGDSSDSVFKLCFALTEVNGYKTEVSGRTSYHRGLTG